ncbi:mitochondrial ribosomal protein of the small subunit [Striga asiatica]|uniref:Mitochondrial ribosomal protein of the small subunit n=1 Tax=Striga asiatica TaxID=4170 RepID=A0A5A7PY63_STRAF|nr:mitochondrial ribosomal protein of the small subunit [Striga asiatica]
MANLEEDSSLEFKKIDNFRKDEEEKMDVLWENLNDECSRNSDYNGCPSPEKGLQISCRKPLRLLTAGGHIFSGKKPIIFVFIKVVKKVLSMQSSTHRIKKQHGDSSRTAKSPFLDPNPPYTDPLTGQPNNPRFLHLRKLRRQKNSPEVATSGSTSRHVITVRGLLYR